MASNKRYIKGFIKTILGQVDIKWDIGEELGNDLSIKPSKN